MRLPAKVILVALKERLTDREDYSDHDVDQQVWELFHERMCNHESRVGNYCTLAKGHSDPLHEDGMVAWSEDKG